MKNTFSFIGKAVLGGLLVVVPIYLAILLLLKGMQSIGKLVKPFTKILPEWLPAEQILFLLVVLAICFVIGLALRTRRGAKARNRMEKSVFEKIPGYATFSNLTRQMAGVTGQNVWKPALVEMEDGLVLAFIVEEFEDGRYTVFVQVDVPFPEAVRAVSQWGAGTQALVTAMERQAMPREAALKLKRMGTASEKP